MLAVSTPSINNPAGKDDHTNPKTNGKESNAFPGAEAAFGVGGFMISAEEFPEFADHGNYLLESIDFDDLFKGIGEGEVLPDLEVDPEELLLGEFRPEESSELNGSSVTAAEINNKADDQDKTKVNSTESNNNKSVDSCHTSKEEVVSKRDHHRKDHGHHQKKKKHKSSSQGKNNKETDGNGDSNQGKRKVKVDWTPELHRRFVQAVEQLGVDKAVPSRILELMGIHCLTRHNIASHLQKYRSHRKHLLAREAEAASWSHKRQVYGAATIAGGQSPWLAAPTLGVPPAIAPLHHRHQNSPHFRPLHVWGHPTLDQSLMHVWPKHIPHSASPPPHPHVWPPQPPLDAAYWHQRQVAGGVTPGTPCFPHVPLPPPTRFGAPAVPGIPPATSHPAMYKPDPGISLPVGAHSTLRPPLDLHPTKESIDEAIGEVLVKPWLPLSLGLKPPSTESVMAELQRQGISAVPPRA